jgi:hypothetical protein
VWIFKQAGQRSGISNFGSIVSNTIVSVLSPVGMAIPIIGQRIMILGTKSPYETRPLLPVQKVDMQKPSRVAPIKMPTIRSDKNIRCTDMGLGHRQLAIFGQKIVLMCHHGRRADDRTADVR